MFYRLCGQNNLNESPNQLVARYIGGMREHPRQVGDEFNLDLFIGH